MNFAKKELEKYGWSDGMGLGRQENGMSTALKPKLKFDNAGVGYDQGKDFTHNWWERVYDTASMNIAVTADEDAVQVQRVGEEVEITTKEYSVRDFQKKTKATKDYGNFIKSAQLTQDGIIEYSNRVKSESSGTARGASKELSDEELFAICGGRTAHKGARHGLTLTGKLKRIEKHEKMLMRGLSYAHKDSSHPNPSSPQVEEESLYLCDSQSNELAVANSKEKEKISKKKKKEQQQQIIDGADKEEVKEETKQKKSKKRCRVTDVEVNVQVVDGGTKHHKMSKKQKDVCE